MQNLPCNEHDMPWDHTVSWIFISSPIIGLRVQSSDHGQVLEVFKILHVELHDAHRI